MVPEIEPALFYTGLVAELYARLRSEDPDPERYRRFIRTFGEPALELGCGDGDPLLALCRAGLEVEGLDSSPDMLARCRQRAADLGLQVRLHESRMETMDLGRRYRSIFLAGATFNLLPDDAATAQALERIRAHLAPNGAALIPLFIPRPVQAGQPREHTEEDGTVLRCTPISVEHDERARRQTIVLRYERGTTGEAAVLERRWTVHWHSQEDFDRLATRAGLAVSAVLDVHGEPATPDADEFAFVLTTG